MGKKYLQFYAEFFCLSKPVKCSKILNSFFSVFFNKMLVINAGIHKKNHVRITNREEPDQTASSEAVLSGSALFA